MYTPRSSISTYTYCVTNSTNTKYLRRYTTHYYYYRSPIRTYIITTVTLHSSFIRFTS